MMIDERALEIAREKAFNELGIDRNYAAEIILNYEAAKAAEQPGDISTDWEEALDGVVESFRQGDLSEWEIHLVRRRVRAALAHNAGIG